MTDSLPLAGIKIVDLSIALTGPYAAALLGDQGGEVVKVERPGFGDIGRYVGVSVNGSDNNTIGRAGTTNTIGFNSVYGVSILTGSGNVVSQDLYEGTNGPTTPDAHKYLHERGVFIVPDILANSSGVTTSYFEWVQDRYGYFWTEKQVNERLEAKMCEAFNAVAQTAVTLAVDMRTAAYVVAINRVATVTRLRGMYA